MHPIHYRGHRRETPLSATQLSVAEEAGVYAARHHDRPRRQLQVPAVMIDRPNPRSVRYLHPPVPSQHHPLPHMQRPQ